ncbi:MAG: hypothetical protein U9O64_08540 [Campylobacterota bacterium]|nr:hypothetical protein [Campylobacterota bacterium]
MKKIYLMVGVTLLLLNGCAGGTTDPRKGGLFSYNPDAYEKRLSDRERRLSSIENDTAAQKSKTARLQNDLALEKSKMK